MSIVDAYKSLSGLITKLADSIKEVTSDLHRNTIGKITGLDKDYNLLSQLVNESYQWVGIHEKKKGHSKSVDSFRKAVDGKAQGEPWCAGFVQYCAQAVSLRTGAKISLYPSESVMVMWNETPKKYRVNKIIPGCIAVWNWSGTDRGHTGIVLREDKHHFYCVEGNTSHPKFPSSQIGRGVYIKKRRKSELASLMLVGFLYPFK